MQAAREAQIRLGQPAPAPVGAPQPATPSEIQRAEGMGYAEAARRAAELNAAAAPEFGKVDIGALSEDQLAALIAVIIPQSSFDRLPIDVKYEAAAIEEQLGELREIIADAQEAGDRQTVKEASAEVKKLRDRLNDLQAKAKERQSGVLPFDQLGVDALIVDEYHAYKKPGLVTKLKRLRGLNKETSQRAMSLAAKIRFIQERARGRGRSREGRGREAK